MTGNSTPPKSSISAATPMPAKFAKLALAPLMVVALAAPPTFAQAPTHDVTITIKRVKALDKLDDLSKGDMYARISIGKDQDVTPVLQDQSEGKPNWKVTRKVTPGIQKIKLELIDKDLTADDPVDINKVAKKRDLEFTLDTNSCRIEGFAKTFKCGADIMRSGTELKKAEIVFSVDVKK